MDNKEVKWIKCDKCESIFHIRYSKNGCPVCGKPIQKHEIYEGKPV